MLVRFSILFFGEGFVPAPEYPETPKTVGGPEMWERRGAMPSWAAVA